MEIGRSAQVREAIDRVGIKLRLWRGDDFLDERRQRDDVMVGNVRWARLSGTAAGA